MYAQIKDERLEQKTISFYDIIRFIYDIIRYIYVIPKIRN